LLVVGASPATYHPALTKRDAMASEDYQRQSSRYRRHVGV